VWSTSTISSSRGFSKPRPAGAKRPHRVPVPPEANDLKEVGTYLNRKDNSFPNSPWVVGKKEKGKMKNDILKLFAWWITISVPGDISDESVDLITRYFKKKARYVYCVIEHGSTVRKHLHAAVVLRNPSTKGDLDGNFWKQYVKPFHPGADRNIAVTRGVHAMHSHEQYDNYLRKEEDVIVLLDQYDRDEVAKFFPTAEQQEQLMQAVVTGRSAGTIGDAYFHKLVQRWIEYSRDDTSIDAARYLYYRMFVARDMTCIRDNRRLCQLAWTMHCYRTQRTEPPQEIKSILRNVIGYDINDQ